MLAEEEARAAFTALSIVSRIAYRNDSLLPLLRKEGAPK